MAAQFSEPNKVYQVTGAISGDVTVGNGSTLVFQGGKITNGKISGNNVTLQFNSISDTFANVTFNGTFRCDHFYPELFGAKGDGKTDDARAIQACLDAAYVSGVNSVKFLPKVYLIASTIFVKPNLQIEGSSFGNIYRTEKATILANLSNTDSYAFDTDVFAPSNVQRNGKAVKSLSNSGKRLDIFHRVENSVSAVYDPNYSSDYYYGGPFNISNLSIKTTNNTFGAIREIGMVNALISGVIIDGFRLGMSLSKGWNFIVERTQIRTSMFGLVLGAEITNGLFNSVQIWCNEKSGSGSSTQKFYANHVETLSHYGDVYKDKAVRTVGIVANQTSATFNSCAVERFQIGCMGYGIKLMFNTPYLEFIKDSIAFVSKGCIQLHNVAGTQGETKSYGYVAADIASQILLNNAPAGSFYPTLADESFNKDYYNMKTYVVLAQNKSANRMTYNASTMIDCNVGDTLFVCDSFPNSTDASMVSKENALMPKNLGNYFMHPIRFKDALERIANDYNYRDVRRLVLIGNVTLNETLNWRCAHPIEVVRDRKLKTLTIAAKQNIACDVKFSKLNITLKSPLCQTQYKDQVFITFEAANITGNAAIVDNSAQLEAPCTNVFISFDKQSTIASRTYFTDAKQATTYHVTLAGKRVSAISGASTSRPSDALYPGYCYFDSSQNKPIWWNGRSWVDSLGNSVDSSRFK